MMSFYSFAHPDLAGARELFFGSHVRETIIIGINTAQSVIETQVDFSRITYVELRNETVYVTSLVTSH